MLISLEKFQNAVLEGKNRFHNYPEDTYKEAFEQHMSDEFDRHVAKCAEYRVGNQIMDEGGPFNVLSLGNWLCVAQTLGVRVLPAQYLATADTIQLFAACMGHDVPELKAFDKALNALKGGEMLRFDACAFSGLKAAISEGEFNFPTGWQRDTNGQVHYEVCDRLVDAFLWNPEPHMVAWSRPILTPMTRGGWSITTGRAGRWPCEWRVFVEEDVIVGVSNYYPQSPASHEDEYQAHMAVSLTQQLLDGLEEVDAQPHHPRYVDQRDENKRSFTADWMVMPDGEMILVECGPAHLTNPNWGGHPCCFDPRKGVKGLSFGLGDWKPLEMG